MRPEVGDEEKISLAKLGKKRPPRSKEWIEHLSEAKRGKTKRQEYNHVRPHSSLGYKPPAPEAKILETLTL